MAAPTRRQAEQMSPVDLATAVAGAVAQALRRRGPADDLLDTGGRDDGSQGFAGAKGAAAYAREKRRFETFPAGTHKDFQARVAQFVGARQGRGVWRYRDLITGSPSARS